jgi:hypothetical protein
MNAAAQVAIAADTNPRFVVHGDGTVTDTRTGLMWTQATVGKKRLTHADAEKACAKLKTADHRDWRLPTLEELESLRDVTRHDPAIDIAVFPDTKSNWYWTSTPAAWSPSSSAWIVYFNYGYAHHYHRYSDAFVRAVRSVSAAPAPGQ